MDIDNIAESVSSLQPRLLDVLACISEGMSNNQIAKALGYKNARTVSTLVYEIYKKLGLEKLSSRTEKRQLASNAFREANTGIVRIRISPFRDVMMGAQTITLDPDTADRVSFLRRQGYQVDKLEMILRKPPPVSR
jgi:DNA-binding CsgD family transcriptional regulator